MASATVSPYPRSSPKEALLTLGSVDVALAAPELTCVTQVWRALFRSGVSSGSKPLRIRFQDGPTELPQAGQQVYDSPGLRVWRTHSGFLVRSFDAAIAIDPEAGAGDGYLGPEFWEAPLQYQRGFFLLSVLFLARRDGYFGLHAGGVEKDGRGLLLIGGSGSGKTTSTLALVRAGWDFLSDDAVMLRRGVEAYAAGRGFACSPATLARFPELGGMPGIRRDDGKQIVDIDSLFAGKPVPRCRPRALLFPEIAGGPSSRLQAIDPTQAFVRLVTQSPGFMAAKAGACDQADVLRELVGAARAYRLFLGDDVFADSHGFASRIAEAVADV